FTNPVKQLGVGHVFPTEVYGPRLLVGLRIIDRELQINVAEIRTVESLDDVQGVAVRMAAIIEPRLFLDADSIDDQRISFPFADRVSVPRWVPLGRQWPSIGEYLSVGMVGLEQHHEQSRLVDDFTRREVAIEVRDAVRKTAPAGPVFGIV